MSITASGFWIPDPSTTAQFQTIFAAEATAAENVLKASRIKDAIPKAASAAALTALFTATTDPATGAVMAPAVGSQGSIGPSPVIWNGTAWVNASQQSLIEASRTSSQNAANGSFSAMGWSTSTLGGPLFSAASSTGITIPVAGWYRIEAHAVFSGNATGRRLLGVGTVAAGAPYAASLTPGASAVNASSYTSYFCQTMLLPAGDIITLYAYQDSGSTLTVSTRRMNLTFIPTT